MKSKIANSLILKVILVLICLLLASELIVLSIVVPKTQDEIQKLLTKEQHAHASSLAMQLDQDVRKRIDLLDNISTQFSKEIIKNNPNQWLAEKHTTFPLFNGGFIIVDQSGQEILDQSMPVNNKVQQDYSRTDWFIDSKNTSSVVIGKPHRSIPENKAQLVMAIALRDNKDNLLAVLAGIEFIESKGMFETINNALIGETGTSMLISPKHEIFVASSVTSSSNISKDGMILTATPKKGANLLHDMGMSGFRGTKLNVNAFGVEHVATLASIPVTDWFLVVRLPTKEAFQPIDKIKNIMILSAAGHGIIVSIFGVLILLYFFKPLKQAAKKINEMAGDENELQTISIKHQDEVGTLIAGFNSLVKKLSKNIECLNQERDKANAANKAKSRFFATASHDLRQPLHALGLFVSTLKQNYHKLNQQKDDEIFAMIDKSLLSEKELFNSILEISKIDSGVLKPDIRSFYINSLCTELESEFRILAAGKKLELSINYDDNTIVKSDELILKRMLKNLITNAIRYTETGSVNVEVKSSKEGVEFIVEDTGVGISPSEQLIIFDEFYQVEQANSSNHEMSQAGLGLGLSIVSRLSDLLKTKIELVSDVGKGSLFSFILPKGNSSEVEKNISQKSYLDTRKFNQSKILVIDDEVVILEAMKLQLESWGCDVKIFSNHFHALDAIKNENYRPELIIIDFRLKDNLKGTEVIKEILTELGSNTPVIVISAETSPDRLNEIHETGYYLLHKPVSPALLRLTIQKKLMTRQ